MTLNAMSHGFEFHRMVVTKKHKCAIIFNHITTDLQSQQNFGDVKTSEMCFCLDGLVPMLTVFLPVN